MDQCRRAAPGAHGERIGVWLSSPRWPTPRPADTGAAELLGTHHLLAAKLAARAGQAGAADDHLDQARTLAVSTGERNTALLHFGPTNVALWTMSVGADLGEGPRDYERVHHDPLDVECLMIKYRSALPAPIRGG